ncbi:LysR family transcriptional regulator [Roseateles paludis]|jgi:DNA-binding transcriptional LysR family regulator|uniref:LysR family transcriptional regulator n=1 Tax=Roseateles paludis TaxID=3145238 RepID=A0ABV0FZB7_9BURK
MPRNFEDLKLGSIELFCRTAELRSFTAAAQASGLTPAAVSRSVSRLEERLGVRLLVRTTRQVRLTDSGQSYYERCRQAIGQLVEAEREVTGEQCVPTGAVRISLPTSYGHHRVLPVLPAFRERYPGITLDVQLTNRNVDFAAEGFDLAVRGRALLDSGLVARKLEDAELVIVATPDYLRRRGRPAVLDELQTHDCIQFMRPATGQVIPWLLRREGADFEQVTRGGFCCSEDILGAVTLARHGAGLLQTYRFIVEDDLQQGRLEAVLPELGGTSRPFSLLYPAQRHMPLRLRVLIDFLLAACGLPRA